MEHPEEILTATNPNMILTMSKLADDIKGCARELYNLTEVKANYKVCEVDIEFKDYMEDLWIKEKIDQEICEIYSKFRALHQARNYSHEFYQTVQKIFNMANSYRNQSFKLVFTLHKFNSIIEPDQKMSWSFKLICLS